MGEVVKQSLGELLDLGGKILEEKDGGFNKVWDLSCVDPEVGREKEVWMDRTWDIVVEREGGVEENEKSVWEREIDKKKEKLKVWRKER